MKLEEIGKKQFLGEGFMAKCYTLENGNVLKLFNNPMNVSEIDRFKYFLKYSNDTILFPFEFIYDENTFYGYITKRALGQTLGQTFSNSNLLNLSTNSYKFERDIDFVSNGGIILYDLHEDNVLYDGNKYTVIDPDEYEKNDGFLYTKESNQAIHRFLINDLFYINLVKFKTSKMLLEKITKYKYLSIKPSQMIVQIKEDIEKYYKEDITTLDDIKNITRR